MARPTRGHSHDAAPRRSAEAAPEAEAGGAAPVDGLGHGQPGGADDADVVGTAEGGGALTDLQGAGAHLLGLGVPGLGADDDGLRTGLRRCRRLGRAPEAGRPPKPAKLIPSTLIVEPDTLVTFPKAPATLVVLEPGRDRAGRAGEAAPGAAPEAGTAAGPEPAPLEAAALDRSGDGDEGGVDLAPRGFGAGGGDAGPHVDVARARATVAVMAVLAVSSTVVCPLVPWTSRSWPRMLAMSPDAAGVKPARARRRGAWSSSCWPPPTGALATSDTASRVPTTRVGRKAWLSSRTVLSISVSFLLLQTGRVNRCAGPLWAPGGRHGTRGKPRRPLR